MHERTGPQVDGAAPDDSRPPLHASDDLAQVEDAVQRLQQTLENHDDGPLCEPMQVTHEAVTLAQSLLHGWQAEQAVTQACLTRWSRRCRRWKPRR